jgi:phage gpG-like protein
MKVVNLDEFQTQLRALADAARGEVLARAVNTGGLVIEGFAKANVQAQGLIDMGNLINSIQTVNATASDTSAEAEIGTNVVYAAIHEFGGTITAKNGKGMVFEVDGHTVMTKSVTIPARPYLRPAIDEHESEIEDAVIGTIQREISKQ